MRSHFHGIAMGKLAGPEAKAVVMFRQGTIYRIPALRADGYELVRVIGFGRKHRDEVVPLEIGAPGLGVVFLVLRIHKK